MIWEAGYTIVNWPDCVPLPREFKGGRKSFFESLRLPELAYLIAHLLAGGLTLIDRLPIPESQRKFISAATGQDATHFRIVTLPLQFSDVNSRYFDQFNGTVRCTVDRWSGPGSASNQTHLAVLGCSFDILRQCYKLPQRLPDHISVIAGSSQLDVDILAAAEGEDTGFDPAFDGVSMRGKKTALVVPLPLPPVKTSAKSEHCLVEPFNVYANGLTAWSDVDEDEEHDLIDEHGNTLVDAPQPDNLAPPAYAPKGPPIAVASTSTVGVGNLTTQDDIRRPSSSDTRVSNVTGTTSRRSSAVGAPAAQQKSHTESEHDSQEDDDNMRRQQAQRASSPDWPPSGDDSDEDLPLGGQHRQVTETEDEELEETPQQESQHNEVQPESDDDEMNASGKRVPKTSSSVSASKRRRIDAPVAARSTRSTASPVKDKKQSKKMVQTTLKKSKADVPEPILIKGYPLQLPASIFEEIGHSHAEVSKAIHAAILCAYPTTGDMPVHLPRRNKPFQVLTKLLHAWAPGTWSIAPLAGTIRLALLPADVPDAVLKALKKHTASTAKASKR